MKDTHSAVRLEEEEFIAATKDLFDLSFERARRLCRGGTDTFVPGGNLRSI